MAKKILAIIPARGESKTIPRKNVKLLAGKPLIAYIIETAKRVKAIERVIVSTEDTKIAKIAKEYGAEIPFMRTKPLATDQTPTLPVVQHAVAMLKEKESYTPDYIMLLYPTSPLLSAKRIEEAIALALKQNADSVVSGTYDKGHYWIESEKGHQRLYPKNLENRQQTQPLFKENGAIYLTKTEILEHQLVADTIVPLIMEEGETIDIDTMEDFRRVERILNRISHSKKL